MRRPKSKNYRLQKRESEAEEIHLLNSWIEFGKPDSGSNPLSFPPLPSNAPVGRLDDNTFSRYAGCTKFRQLPLSKRTKDGLRDSKKYSEMTEIQRASLPHALCGRDILGAAKTGSGKTLAFIIPVLEILYKARWGPEDGVGGIIISPTRELADQIFGVLNIVGKHHEFSAGRLIGGQKDIDMEKEHANDLNILICTPGRLLQHMDETPNFDCSQLQVLVLDEADRILDVGFKKELNAIVSQLPKHRQTLLFSATQTKSVKDLARLSLKDPEYISVHEEATTATPTQLHQTAMIVPLDQKLDMLWSFIKSHLNSKILVFLTTCKQAKFAFETFKKLRPGIPLKCLHGRMKQERRLGIYSQFCEARSVVLFATDVASRGLDFNKNVDWVVQVDCPDDVAGYIHRVGRTARYLSSGKSVLFIMPSEMKMHEKLQDKKIPIKFIKVNANKMQHVSKSLADKLVKYTELQALAERAFITYLKSINFQKDKEVFDVTKLPIDEFAASLGLPMTPKISFKPKNKGKPASDNCLLDIPTKKDLIELPKESPSPSIFEEAEELLLPKDEILAEKPAAPGYDLDVTRVLKKKKLKINVHKPLGTRVVFDEEGKALPPLATLADTSVTDTTLLDKDKVNKRFAEMREEMKIQDKEDKRLDQKRRKEKRLKEKLKSRKEKNEEEDESEEGNSGSDRETRGVKRTKKYFDSDDNDYDDDGGEKKIGKKKKMGLDTDSISLAEQEELALKLLNSMNS